jgi:hypothetical protein
LNPDDLVTGHVFAADGSEVADFTRMGNGRWEGVIHHSGEYTITAEAEGYISHPASYKIWVEGETTYVLTNDEIGEEALHIDFQFLPCGS